MNRVFENRPFWGIGCVYRVELHGVGLAKCSNPAKFAHLCEQKGPDSQAGTFLDARRVLVLVVTGFAGFWTLIEFSPCIPALSRVLTLFVGALRYLVPGHLSYMLLSVC